MNLQTLLLGIEQYWARRGCLLEQPYDMEVGAGTLHPATFFRVLGPEPWRVAYCQPSRRPADARFGENPMRVYKHYQFQVILKPAPEDAQELYLDSLRAFGVNPAEHDIRFEEDDWEAPTLGAAGVGWQVLMDGMEISQFTYFQQAGGIELAPISVELTYGMERICMFLNDLRNVFEIPWSDTVRYGDLRLEDERQQSEYAFRVADPVFLREEFERWEAEAERLLGGGQEAGALFLPAYECALRCSHLFNLLDARGGIGVQERAALIGRIRRLACQCAKGWLETRGRAGLPLPAAAGDSR